MRKQASKFFKKTIGKHGLPDKVNVDKSDGALLFHLLSKLHENVSLVIM